MKAFVITGASRGLGSAVFDRLRAEAANSLIVPVYRTSPPTGTPETALICDLADPGGQSGAFQQLFARLTEHQVDEVIFINNAGAIHPIGGLSEFGAEELVRHVNSNLVSPMLLASGLANVVERLTIVNVSSGAAKRPLQAWSLYCACKAGMHMFCEAVALEPNVEVIQFMPGVMDTGMQADVRSADSSAFAEKEKFHDLLAAGHLRAPDEVAAELLGALRERSCL